MKRCIENIDRPCLYCQRIKFCCCCKRHIRIILGVVMFGMSIAIITNLFDSPNNTLAERDNYQQKINKQSDCLAYCGQERSFAGKGTTCCQVNQESCIQKSSCYDQQITIYNIQLYLVLGLLGISFTYLEIYLIYYIFKLIRMLMRKKRAQALLRGSIEYYFNGSRIIIDDSIYMPGMPNQIDKSLVQKLISKDIKNNYGLEESVPLKDSQNVCAICLEGFSGSKVVELRCEHFFHSQCIKSWVRVHKKCPLCRTPTEQPKQILKI